jgi:hypothetical protein
MEEANENQDKREGRLCEFFVRPRGVELSTSVSKPGLLEGEARRPGEQ